MSDASPRQIAEAVSCARLFAAKLRESDPGMDADDLLLALDSETPVLDMIRSVIRASLDADAFLGAMDVRIESLKVRKERFAARKDATRNLAIAMMSSLGIKSLPDTDFTASLSASRARPIVTDQLALPPRFVRTTTSKAPDMAAIGVALKAGETVPGVEMSNGGVPQLTIRTR